MSGFLRQLASRSLGMAPRLRSAAVPAAAARHGALVDDGWPIGAANPVAAATELPGDDVSDAWPPLHPHSARAPHPDMRDVLPRDGGHDPLVRDANEPPPAPRSATPRGESPAHAMTLAAQRNTSPVAPTRRADEAAAMGRPPGPSGTEEPMERQAPPRSATSRAETWPTRPATTASPVATRQAENTHATRDTTGAVAAQAMPHGRAAPDVHITIDRLEVAPPAPAPRPAPPARSGALSLRAYLAARRSGLP